VSVPDTTQWWAHRGTLEHENTLRGIEDALDAGVDGVEVDLQLSADGQVFLFHDESLKRLAGHEAIAGELRWEQLREVSLHCGERMPLLEELLQMWPEGKTLNLELKAGGVPLVTALIPLLAGYRLDDVVISSFDGTMLNAAGAMSWPRAMLIERVSPTWIHQEGAKRLRCPMAFLEAVLVDENVLRRYAAEDIEVGIWGATSAEQESQLEALGVRRIISDFRVVA
jgi:glycerophosphoryl diester phosphodiesterase